ncbi:hypothetical protein D3C71_256700 [compost metagenome]
MTDTAIQSPASSGIGDEDDLRLVLDAFREAAAQGLDGVVAGHVRTPSDRACSIIEELFGSAAAPAATVSVRPTAADGTIDVSLEFDLHRITADIRGQIAAGIGRNRVLMDILGGVPVEVSDRLDAARAAPRLAGHLIATAADHLVWKVRLHVQDTLAPVYDDAGTLSWSGEIGIEDKAAHEQLGRVVHLATAIRLEIPASMENSNV